MATHSAAPDLPWRIEDIDFSQLDRARVVDDEQLFYLVTTASFVESASDLYSRNLTEHFAGDDGLCQWLDQHWEPEELQHGRALRAYVEAVWPEFDWERAYASFLADYGARCTMEELEDERALELAARCVVETGTASFYRTLHNAIDEPVLKAITGHIKDDEVRHYKYFYRYFRHYTDPQPLSRWSVLRTLLARVAEAKNDDGLVAFEHALKYREPGAGDVRQRYRRFDREVKALCKRHFPYQMAVRMLLTPLHLTRRWQRPTETVLVRAARGLLFG